MTPAERAWKLLADHLTPEQRADLATKHYFDVVTSGERRWRVSRKRADFNIQLKSNGRHKELPTNGIGNIIYVNQVICVDISRSYRRGDRLLAQKLALESDELTLLNLANT
jgi:hypothetical protein